jgi:hypothetical protein
MEVVMDQYGSSQYGLYSGLIRPGLAYLKQKRGQLPPGFQSQIPRMEREALSSVMGAANPQGQVFNALKILKRLGFKPRSASNIDLKSAYRSAVKQYHGAGLTPDPNAMKVLNRAWETLKQNLGYID